jgi:hypothetical protein
MDTKEVLKAVEKLADKLGTTAEQLFGYYVKNAKIYKYVFIAQSLFCLLLTIAGIVWLVNSFPFPEDYVKGTFDNMVWPVKAYFGVIGGSLIGLIGLISTLDSLSGFSKFINSFVNPEYEATEDLFSSLF